jgi:hypothetical protein
MGQAKRRGTYEECKAEGVAKAIKAEAERQERLRDDRGRLTSTPKGNRSQLMGAALLGMSMLGRRLR